MRESEKKKKKKARACVKLVPLVCVRTCSETHIYYVSSLAVFPAEVQQRVAGLHVDEAFPRVCRHRTATQRHLSGSELNQTAWLSSSVTCTAEKSHSSLLHVYTANFQLSGSTREFRASVSLYWRARIQR